MSFPEILDQVRSLAPDKKLELFHILQDEISLTASHSELPEEMRRMLPPPGVIVSAGSQITTDAEGWKVIETMLTEIEAKKS